MTGTFTLMRHSKVITTWCCTKSNNASIVNVCINFFQEKFLYQTDDIKAIQTTFAFAIWLRNYFDFLPQHVEEQIVTSKENMALSISRDPNRYRRLMVPKKELWQEGYISEKERDATSYWRHVTIWWVGTALWSNGVKDSVSWVKLW